MATTVNKRLAMVTSGVFAGVVMTASVQAGEIRIGFITPLSGPIASQGVPFARGIAAGEHHVGEVNGHTITLIQLDDASDPSVSARNARKLIDEDNVDVLIGTGGVPGAMALASISREAEVPLVSFTPLFLPPERADWAVTTAQPADLMIEAVVNDMAEAGIESVGYIGFSDSWGDLAYNELLAAAETAGIDVVANERYARADTSVTGQALKLMVANPDAVLGGTAGTPGALPYIALSERGYDGAIYGTHGIINPDFVRVAGDTANNLLAPTGPVIVSEQLPDDHPSKDITAAFNDAYTAVHDQAPTDAFSAYAFDAWTVIVDAAARVSPDIEPGTPEYRAALRDAIFETNELPVTHGVLSFQIGSPYGADDRSVVMVRLEDGNWALKP